MLRSAHKTLLRDRPTTDRPQRIVARLTNRSTAAQLAGNDGLAASVSAAGHGCRDGARRQEMNKIGGQAVVLGGSMSGHHRQK